MTIYPKDYTSRFPSKIFSAAVIIITLLATVTAAFILPSPIAIAEGIDKITITPGISPAQADDGIRLFLDNVKLPELDRWFDQGPAPTPYKAQRTLVAGNHTIKVEYYENGGGAVARAGYEKVPDVVSGGIYRLVSQCSGKVLDVDGGKLNDGANVQQWGWANVAQQKWKIDSLGGGLYKLTAQHSQKVLEVYEGSTLYFGNLDQWNWLTTTNNFQKWSIQNGGAGFAKLLAGHDSQALDVYNASLNDGANVDQYWDNNTCAQKWKLDKL